MLKKIYLYNNYDPATRTIAGELKEPIVFDDVSPGADYTEQTTVKQVSDVLKISCIDNLYFQDKTRESFLSTTWNDLTDEERMIMIDVSVGDVDAQKVGFLMGQGKTQAEAVKILSDAWVFNFSKNKRACRRRFESKALADVLAKYLTIEDAEDLETTTGDLISSYFRGKRGKVHEGGTYSWLDYFNSTIDTPYELAGLKENKNYIMQNGDPDMTNFIADVLNVLLNGNY